MTFKLTTSKAPRYLLWTISLLAPSVVGAKGCDVAVVGSECGGLAGTHCGPEQYCKFPATAACGAADVTGTCTAVPEVCADIYSPVCGCDDKTYSNACEANAKGVSVAKKGECQPAGDDCGGLMGLECQAGEFCNYPEDAICGTADATGTCTELPEVCTAIYSPVCGCDGVTYGNACEANASGVSVAAEGECNAGPDCGGLLGVQCASGEFCNYGLDDLCGATDAMGSCTELPTVCDAELAPVCGCDDKTYDNACSANAAGISVAYYGACGSGTGGMGTGGMGVGGSGGVGGDPGTGGMGVGGSGATGGSDPGTGGMGAGGSGATGGMGVGGSGATGGSDPGTGGTGGSTSLGGEGRFDADCGPADGPAVSFIVGRPAGCADPNTDVAEARFYVDGVEATKLKAGDSWMAGVSWYPAGPNGMQEDATGGSIVVTAVNGDTATLRYGFMSGDGTMYAGEATLQLCNKVPETPCG